MPILLSNFIITNVAVSLCSLFFFYVIGKNISHYFSKSSLVYRSLEKKLKEEWHDRNLSSLHAAIAVILPLIVLIFDKDVSENLFWGTSRKAEIAVSITVGYIASDLLYLFSSSPEITDVYWTSVAHHVVVLFPYAAVMCSGSLMYFAIIRLLAEISTPFVNFRWMLDVGKMKSTSLYVYNGWMMMITFFVFRILAMPYCYYLMYTISSSPHFNSVKYFAYFYAFNAIIVDSLNLYWFCRMIKGAMKYYKVRSE